MGLAFDKMLNKPPFGPKCDPECTPNPSRGNICYKGKCMYDCPEGSFKHKGKCKCHNFYTHKNKNKKIKIVGVIVLWIKVNNLLHLKD